MTISSMLLVVVLVVIISFEIFADPQEDDSVQNKREIEDLESGELDRAGNSAQGQAHAIAGARGSIALQPRHYVDCYVCTDCPFIQANTTSKSCPDSSDSSKNNRCVVYVEKYKHLKKPWYIRGCASERGSCADIKLAHEPYSHIVQLLSCLECEGDRCNTNGVSHSFPNVIISLFVVVIFPLIGKYTLS